MVCVRELFDMVVAGVSGYGIDITVSNMCLEIVDFDPVVMVVS